MKKIFLLFLTCTFITQVQAQIETIVQIEKHPFDTSKFAIVTIEVDSVDNIYNPQYSSPLDSQQVENLLFSQIESKKENLIEYKRLIREAEKEINQEAKEAKKLTAKKYKKWVTDKYKEELKGNYILRIAKEKIEVKINSSLIAVEVVKGKDKKEKSKKRNKVRRFKITIDSRKLLFIEIDKENVELILNDREVKFISIDKKVSLKKI